MQDQAAGGSGRYWRYTLVVAWVVAVGVLAFLITSSGASGSAAQHRNEVASAHRRGAASSAHGARAASSGHGAHAATTDRMGDPRFATDTNAAVAQYQPPEVYRQPGRTPSRATFDAAAVPTTQSGLPFTGENVLEVIALGLLLAGGGLLLARRVRTQPRT